MTRTVLKAPAESEGGTAPNASVRDTVVGVIEDSEISGFGGWTPKHS